MRFVGAPSWPERAAAALRLPARREVAPALRLARPGRAVPLPLPAAPRRAGPGRRRHPAHADARLHALHAPGGRAPARATSTSCGHRTKCRRRRSPAPEPAQPLRAARRRRGGRRRASRPWAHAARGRGRSEPPAGPRPLARARRARQVAALRRTPRRRRAADERPRPPLTSGASVLGRRRTTLGLEPYWQARRSTTRGPRRPTRPRPPAAPTAPARSQVLDALLLLAETYPDPEVYFARWDRLRADEEAHAGVADDTLAREESEEDRVVIGTIHAAKGREYDSVVIPDYDCDVTRWEPREVEEERRVVYVGVTRARDAALFTVDTSTGLRPPVPARAGRAAGAGGARDAVVLARGGAGRVRRGAGRGRRGAPRAHRRPPRGDRGALPGARPRPPKRRPRSPAAPVTAATAAATAPAARRSASPPAPYPASGSAAGPPAVRGR